MSDNRYSGLYTSVYSFFDLHPELKPNGWEDVQSSDVDDMLDAVEGEYRVFWIGNWNFEVRCLVSAKLSNMYDYHIPTDEHDIVVIHEDEYLELMKLVLEKLHIDFGLDSLNGKKVITIY